MPNSPFSVVFLLHILLELPLGYFGSWNPQSLPFIQLTNTTLVILKLYSSLIVATCLMAFLCYSLPEFLPGKRALALGLCIYHAIASTTLLNAPRFIPLSLGDAFEAYNMTPERIWAAVHGLLGLGMVIWWQGTLGAARLAAVQGRS